MSHDKPITVEHLKACKQRGEKIVMLTAYDATFAAAAERAGADCVLVGDSLGQVIQGRESTLPVTVEEMAYHTRAARRGLRRALLIADMPFMSYHDDASAAAAARTLIGAGGAAMVKLEGAGAVVDRVAHLAAYGAAVCGHLGLTPQWVHRLGGYRVQGRGADAAALIGREALALEQAGAQLLILECVPAALAAELTRQLAIPVIGIGAGAGVDGQVLVLHDALGLNPRPPRFVRDFMAAGGGSIAQGLAAFAAAVRSGDFPGPDEQYD